ncbi:hypothetical protein [Pseudoduganella chitinolytica]|uniref:Uncharacterized protein n=1 Tax=Pseudoduganella chitinolytica TaxID=34070 RepID=A0ABY8BIK8_9BURK|nr:hypothetical protein [Pseudoduganella chitinolytica]WEF35735.1 hypothetical protein PX653_13605 [Pseudoduganella chitinolytica]
MTDREKNIMQAYDALAPDEKKLFSVSNVNHLAWSLVIVLVLLLGWFAAALVNAENQRHALMTRQCQDRVFKEEVDKTCLLNVRSREHWWQHVSYALSHLSPSR